MLTRAYDFVLRMPEFRGKAMIAAFLRNRLAPKASTVVYGLRMELDPREWPQIDLRALGCLEPKTTALFRELLRKGDIYIDVGSHVGYHVLVACHFIGESGRIFALDPQPYNCDRLLTNAALNGFANITVIAAAVSSAGGFVSLKSQSSSDKSRLTLAGAGINDESLTFIAPAVTLAWVVEAHALPRVDLLKIDVEGFEFKVLEGASPVLHRVRNIIFEILPNQDHEDARKIEELLRSFGFRMFDVEGADWRPGQPCVENNVWARRP
jgi:FkbM family methyltransferase